MGCRITDKLRHSEYEVSYLEINPQGIERLKAKGVVSTANPEKAVPEADFIILTVPDIYIKKVAEDIVPKMKPGAMAVCLDPAAPLAGALPDRPDVSF